MFFILIWIIERGRNGVEVKKKVR